jgi:hypothetical protein
MKLSTKSFVEHRTAVAQEIDSSTASSLVLGAPGGSTSCLTCTCCSCCCGAARLQGTEESA